MAHTNQTAHYHLPQYVGTDIINPLTDTNKAYEDIDTALYEQGQSIADANDDIDALKIQNGDNTLDTTAQTLSGAVNELKGDADALGLRVTANETDISTLQTQMSTATGNITTLNTSVAGLQTEVASKASATALDNLTTKVGTGNLDTVAQNCVDAINELATQETVTVTADGVKSYGALIAEIFSTMDASKITGKTVIDLASSIYHIQYISSALYTFVNQTFSATASTIYRILLASTGGFDYYDGSASHDRSSEVPASGLTIKLVY